MDIKGAVKIEEFLRGGSTSGDKKLVIMLWDAKI